MTKLDSNAALDDLFEQVCSQLNSAIQLSAEVQRDGDELATIRQLMLLANVQSQLLFGIYAELSAERRERRGGRSSGRYREEVPTGDS